MADSLFEQSLSISLAGAPAQLRVGSFSGQRSDLVVAAATGREKPTVTLLSNIDAGTRYAESGVQLSLDRALVQRVATADFNGDGRDDFAVAGDDLGLSPARTVVSIYLSEEGGTLRLAGQHTLHAVFPRCLEAGNFDGVAGDDIAVCHSIPSGGAGLVLLRGDGVGGFTAAAPVGIGSTASASATADVDGDGVVDLMVADTLGGKVRVVYGGPAFGEMQAAADVDEPHAVAPLSGGRVMAVSGPVARAVVFESSNRSLSQVSTYPLSGAPVAALGADLDDDGILEGAVLTRKPDAVLILEINVEDEILLRETVSLGAEANSFVAGDLSDDGLGDIAIASEAADRLFILVNDGPDLPPPALCAPSPATVCGTSSKSVLKIRNSSDDSLDGLRWLWQTPANEINSGDPTKDSIVYAFCFYSRNSDGSTRLIQSHTNAGTCAGLPCWASFRRTGYRYSDPAQTYQGIGRVALGINRKGSMKMSVKGHGGALSLPVFPLATGGDAIAQLVNDRGACWETVFPSSSVRSGSQFYSAKQKRVRAR